VNIDKNQNAIKDQEYQIIRKRWDKEDDLLLSRTGIFLTANSILLAASQLNDDFKLRIGITILSLLISILWLTTSWHSFNIIAMLFKRCKDKMPNVEKELYHIKPLWFRPNTVFCKLLPSLVILGWLVYLYWNLTSR